MKGLSDLFLFSLFGSDMTGLHLLNMCVKKQNICCNHLHLVIWLRLLSKGT